MYIGYALLGVQVSQPVSGPATFLRMSEILHWVLSVPGLGQVPAGTLRLEITDAQLPQGVTVDVHQAWRHVDSLHHTCQVSEDEPKAYLDRQQAMWIRVSKKENCTHGCAAAVKIAASVTMLDCQAATQAVAATDSCPEGCVTEDGICKNPKCELSLDWPALAKLEHVGKMISGGLGGRARTDITGDRQMWTCVRDWDWEAMKSCGVGLGQARIQNPKP